jgi:hypothetical protein
MQLKTVLMTADETYLPEAAQILVSQLIIAY